MDTAAVAAMEYAEYITAVAEQRRRDSQSDDLIGTLVHAEIDGNRLDEGSIIYESLLILIGGDETTRHVISGGMYELLRHPDQLSSLAADRSLLPAAVEEMLRWVSPIKNMARTMTRDVELHGETLREGQKLLLLYPSANRDEPVFDAPRGVRHHPDAQRPHGLRVRLPLLPGQPAGPHGAHRDVRPAARPAARPGPGRRPATAQAGGQLRLRLRDHAGGLHADGAGGGERPRWPSRS